MASALHGLYPGLEGSGWSSLEEAEAFDALLRERRAGKVSDDKFRRFRLQHGVYAERLSPDSCMVRVKVPGGAVTPEQLEAIADLSEEFSVGGAHITTRQDFQLHWVRLEEAAEVLRGLAKVGLTTREAAGNSVRNVVVSPMSGICPDEPFDVRPYAVAVARFFLRNPLVMNLPRKFKVNFSCCWAHGLARIGDVGAIPRLLGPRRGFTVYFGGGLGLTPYIGEPLEEFTPEEELLPTLVAVLRLFDRMGDRVRAHRNRMRYLVREVGVERFRRAVLEEREVVEATMAPSAKPYLHLDYQAAEGGSPPPDGPAEYAEWLETSVVAQRQRGFYAAYAGVPCGDISARQLRAVAELVRAHSAEGLAMLTYSQDLMIRWVSGERLPVLFEGLRGCGLGSPGALTIASVVGCTGRASCNLAITNSHRLAKEIRRRLLDDGLHRDPGLRGATVKISGCPDSCGQHWVATIGLFGGAVRYHGWQAPAYQLLIGGSADGERAALGKVLLRVPARRAVDAVHEIIKVYFSTRDEGERLTDWAARVAEGKGPVGCPDANALGRALAHLADVPPLDVAPELYSDLGSDEKFRAKTARGECAP